MSSCRQGEGASTIVFNMGIALSQSTNRRILIVDSNARTPILHTWFKVSAPDSPGLMDVLEGKSSFNDVVKRDKNGTLGFIPVGHETKHPIVLFDSKGFDQFLYNAREQFSIIIFDSPALMGGPETTVLRKLDGFIMVIEAERTRWEGRNFYKEQLTDAGVQFTGAILNKKQMFIPRLVYRLLLAD